MSQQRMAGGQEFKQGMESASKPRGGSNGGGGRSRGGGARAGGPQLIGAGAWDRQVERESAQKIMLRFRDPIVPLTLLTTSM